MDILADNLYWCEGELDELHDAMRYRDLTVFRRDSHWDYLEESLTNFKDTIWLMMAEESDDVETIVDMRIDLDNLIHDVKQG